jgi:hypothetical protein
MKRDFLANFKIGDQALSKEAIDAIMAENGRDIEAAKKDAVGLRAQLKEAQDGLKAFEGVDVDKLTGKIEALTAKLDAQAKKHEAELSNLKFDHALADAITAAHGRNARAISALLDVDKLRQSTDQTKDIAAAIDSLKESDSYLFDDNQGKQTPPPFAAGAGTAAHTRTDDDTFAAFRAAAGLPATKE